ncbi:sigma-54-dependent Fis family transcriptional regulator, partial [Mesorhizobium sp. M00.F.Ca.ET.186.01.1.1]
SIHLPPLRKRSDIIQVAEHLMQQIAPEQPSELLPGAKAKLAAYSWPGNVRELQGVLVQAAFLSDGDDIGEEHIQLEGLTGEAEHEQGIPSLRETELVAIRRALHSSGGNVSKAAKLLQIGRNTLYRKMAEYQLGAPFYMGEP